MKIYNQRIPELLKKIWRLLSVKSKWNALWLAHDKFIIGVSGVVLNDKNQVLLLQHRFWPEGSWGLPSGYAKTHEKFEDTLKREIREETNYKIKNLQLLSIDSGYKLRTEISYIARLAGGKIHLDNMEVIQAKFFSTRNLPNGTLPSHVEKIRNALKELSFRKY